MAALKQDFFEREAQEREWTEELAFIAKTKGFAAAFDHAQLADQIYYEDFPTLDIDVSKLEGVRSLPSIRPALHPDVREVAQMQIDEMAGNKVYPFEEYTAMI